VIQENNIPACAIVTRSSATAERQRVSYTRLSRHWSCTSRSTASVLQLYYNGL